MVEFLENPQIEELLTEIPGWEVENNVLHRKYILLDFAEALTFVAKIGVLAQELEIYPEIDIRWNQVFLRISDSNKKGLTNLHFSLANKIEALD